MAEVAAKRDERQMLPTKLIHTHAVSGGCDEIILLVVQGDIPASGGAATHLGCCLAAHSNFFVVGVVVFLRGQEVEVCQDKGRTDRCTASQLQPGRRQWSGQSHVRQEGGGGGGE